MKPYFNDISIPTVKHGDSRNHQKVIKHHGDTTFVDDDGSEVYRGPTCTLATFTEERFCGTCEKWQTIEGIMGVIGGCPQCGRQW